MAFQQPAKPATTFVYPNKLELGEGVDHNGITVGEWSNGFFNCCDDIVPNGMNFASTLHPCWSSNLYTLVLAQV